MEIRNTVSPETMNTLTWKSHLASWMKGRCAKPELLKESVQFDKINSKS